MNQINLIHSVAPHPDSAGNPAAHPTHTQMETDGSKAAEELKRKRVKKEKGGKREMERERKAEVGEYKETQGTRKGKTGRNIRDQKDDKKSEKRG